MMRLTNRIKGIATMLALRKTGPEFGAVLEEVAEPELAPGFVMVEVDAAGICGSDIHMYEWTNGYEWLIPALPVTMGHEFAGRVSALGLGVTGLSEGQPVVVMPSYACGKCDACLAGKPEVCTRRKAVGLSVDGGFAPRVPVPVQCCLPIGNRLAPHIAALTEPFCVGDRAVDTADVQAGQDVVVLGPGIIGLSAAYIAKQRGASSVTIVGKNDPLRLDIARKIGIGNVIDLGDNGTLADFIPERSVDRVLEATGFGESITQGLGLLRDFGIMAAIGIHHEPAPIDITPFVRRKLQLRGAHSSTRANWDRVLEMLPDAADEIEPIVTHQISLADGIEGFEMSRRREACKVVIRPGM